MIAEEIEWKEEYGIGVEIIDNDHKELFRIARRLFMLAGQPNSSRWGAEEGIKYLKQYCMRHFENEERHMRSINYPALPEQLAQHAHFRDKVVPKIESRLVAGGYSRETIEKFLRIMNLWLVKHILEYDKKIGA